MTRKNFVAPLVVFVVTVTVAAALFALPQLLLTRTQYEVVLEGETVTLGPVPPVTGDAVLPLAPAYH